MEILQKFLTTHLGKESWILVWLSLGIGLYFYPTHPTLVSQVWVYVLSALGIHMGADVFTAIRGNDNNAKPPTGNDNHAKPPSSNPQ